METLIIYSLKVSIAIALFYCVYFLFLRKDTFFKLNRFYFLFALVFSLVLPFLNIGWQVSEKSDLPVAAYMMSEIELFVGGQVAPTSGGINDFGFLLISTFMVVVAVGILFLAGRLVIQLFSLYLQLYRVNTERKRDGNIIEITDNSISSFSFFSWIVINTANKGKSQIQDIFIHERAHVREWHSIDVMLYELFCILFWWNPFVWLIKGEMKLNLEYLADKAVQREKGDFRDYQYTLLQISGANTGVAFINNFNVSQLKKRITMMNKKRSSMIGMGKFFFALPLAIGLLLGNVVYATSEVQQSTKSEGVEQVPERKEPIFTVVEEMPTYQGGEQAMMKFVGENLKYPEEAQVLGVQGRVTVRFVIEKTGDISEVSIVKNITDTSNEVAVVGYLPEDENSNKDLLEEAQKMISEEAMRVVKAMPNWTPGKQKGKVVPVYFTLPILFKLR